MRILVTGITGFAGGHLAEALLSLSETQLYGTSRRGIWPDELRHLADRAVLQRCDLGDPASVDELLQIARPDRVYHLAGYARVGPSFREPAVTWRDNLDATRCLYDAIARWGGK